MVPCLIGIWNIFSSALKFTFLDLHSTVANMCFLRPSFAYVGKWFYFWALNSLDRQCLEKVPFYVWTSLRYHCTCGSVSSWMICCQFIPCFSRLPLVVQTRTEFQPDMNISLLTIRGSLLSQTHMEHNAWCGSPDRFRCLNFSQIKESSCENDGIGLYIHIHVIEFWIRLREELSTHNDRISLKKTLQFIELNKLKKSVTDF